MASRLAVVFGGSGFVGRNVVRELAKRGWRVRVAVRRPHLALFLQTMGAVGQIQLKQANVRHRPSVAEALKGADAAVNLVGVLHGAGGQSFEAVHAGGAASIASLAAAAGAERLAHLSAIGADPESKSIYAQTKARGEAAMRGQFPSATILRPSIVFGSEDDFFNRFATMALYSPFLPLIGGGATRFQPVYVDDVADAVCEALERPDAQGRTYELGGPRVYSFKELLTLMLVEIGRKRILLPLPFPLASAIGIAGEFTGRFPFIEPILTRDQVRQLKRDNVVDLSGDVGVLSDLGVEPQSLEAILPGYMVRYRKYGQFAGHAA